jgi:hypothetical protein
MVAAIIHDCNTPSKREEYIKAMQNHELEVHVYGMCGEYNCKDGTPNHKHPRGCYEALSKQYLFYLAFENASCQDYVSENLFLSLLHPWVPVVRGGADYSKFLPDKVAIDASDMTPGELAEEMKRIASNETLYFEYFEWRRHWEQTTLEYRQVDTCKICNKLRETKLGRRNSSGNKWYPSMYDWWYGDSQCDDV